jgi:hypothetical protein
MGTLGLLLLAAGSAGCPLPLGAGGEVDCEACLETGISIQSTDRPLRAIELGSDCADARVSPATYVGDEYQVPQYGLPSFFYRIDPMRPGTCSFDLVLEDGRSVHYSVDMVLADDECCFGLYPRGGSYGGGSRIVVAASQANAGAG